MTDYDFAQRAVLGAILEAHPRLIDVEQLEARLSDVPRVPEALRVLIGDGLATQLGDAHELAALQRVDAPRCAPE